MDLLGQEKSQSKSIISYNVLKLLIYKLEKVRTSEGNNFLVFPIMKYVFTSKIEQYCLNNYML